MRDARNTFDRFLDLDFALSDGQSFGVNSVFDSSNVEGMESVSFSLRTSVVAIRDVDTDGDGIANHLDIDSDNDGITDNIEAQTTNGFIAPSGIEDGITDLNMDGLDDNFDSRNVVAGDSAATEAEALIVPVNTDGTDNADYLDTNSDNEGASDALEAGFTDDVQTGLSDSSTDADGDGLFDVFDLSLIHI